MSIKEKRRIVHLLQTADIDTVLAEICSLPGPKVINPLFAGLCSINELVRWHAITAMGIVVADMAENDREAARIIMRRLMWSLNDESGGIGWGAPEAMAEIMACHEGLASEYAHILVSYMREDGNFLEHEALQRGVLWGVCRLAQARSDLVRKWQAGRYLPPYLDSGDATCRGLAALALGLLNAGETRDKIQNLLDDSHPFRLYWDRTFIATSVGRLAARALTDIAHSEAPPAEREASDSPLKGGHKRI